MKVSFTSEMKKIVTIADIPAVRKVIDGMRDDTYTAKDYAEMAARIASGHNCVEVLKASAEIAGNCRVWDAFAEGSGKYDVWINFTAYTGDGFVMGGAYLTDLWAADGDNSDEIRNHMYIRKFFEIK